MKKYFVNGKKSISPGVKNCFLLELFDGFKVKIDWGGKFYKIRFIKDGIAIPIKQLSKEMLILRKHQQFGVCHNFFFCRKTDKWHCWFEVINKVNGNFQKSIISHFSSKDILIADMEKKKLHIFTNRNHLDALHTEPIFLELLNKILLSI